MKRTYAALAIIIAVVIVGVGAMFLLNPEAGFSGKPESITIGIKHAEANALIYIADDRGFFSENRLDLTMITYTTKLQAFNAMVAGDVDMSIISEYPFVAAVIEKKDIRIIASSSRYQDQYLVARKDRGIGDVPDLAGKKIGVPVGTIGEFYFGRYLGLHNINLQDVTVENIPFAQAADALFDGSVDAVLIYDGAPRSSEVFSGSDFISWPVQSGQASYDVITCNNDRIASHPEAIYRFLKSLDQAAEYLIYYPAEGKAIVQNKLGRTEAQMATIWPRFQFSVILDQSLILAMEDEGRWMIENSLASETIVPDFLEYIYIEGLEKVKPESVNIIR
jgi:NitT/TauT family transport system substrate-binding protein